MTLLIECPNGCRLRSSESKAGKIVKCPTCKALIQIAPLSEAKVETVRTVVKAKYVASQQSPPETSNPQPSHRVLFSQVGDGTPVSDVELDELPKVVDRVASNDLPDRIELPEIAESSPNSSAGHLGIRRRTKSAQEDRVLLARIYAVGLVVIGVVNLLPFAIGWFQAYQAGDAFELSRWMFLQVFLGSVLFVYAVFLAQVPDWTALLTVAVAALIIAVTFGIASTGLVVAGREGIVGQFLELRFGLAVRATCWCVAMLVLMTLFSFVAGREAINWRRTEQLLREIAGSRAE